MMQNKSLLSEILSQTRTKEEADLLLGEIEALEESLFKTDKGALEKTLGSCVRLELVDEFRKLFSGDKDNVRTFLADLRQSLGKLKTIKITVGFEPREVSIEKFHRWLSENMGEGILMDIEVDKSLLGGASLAYNGKYADFSLKSTLEPILKEKKSEILKLLS